MAGYDCAAPVQDVSASAHSEFGADPGFWMRYFTPSPAADIFANDSIAESEAVWASGARAIGAITAPTQSRLAGSQAEGQADAQTFVASMTTAYHTVHPLLVPSNQMLFTWLDQEFSTALSLGYLDGWALFIANNDFGALGTFPLYPCVYCTPSAPPANCSTFAQATGLAVPAAVWTPEPQVCDGLADPPAWDPEECSQFTASTVPTKLWQYAEQGACGFSANVDLDQGAPGFNNADFCFLLSSDP